MIRHPDKLYFDGRWVAPSSPAQIEVIDPTTELTLYHVADAQAADVARATAAARAAFDTGPWPRMTHVERAEYLRAMGAAIESRIPEFSHVWSSQMGIINSAARASTARSAQRFSYYSDLAETYPWIERHTPTSSAAAGFLVREPVGVVAAIIPWNAPVGLITYKVAPALLAGCTVVLKAAPEAPGEAYLFAEIAEEVGLPAGVFNVLTADREVSELLVRDPLVDKITFTGSTAAGRLIAAICGERIARCTLELGGKSAAVVLDDYDIEAAAGVLAAQACHMSGQVCASLSRVIVSQRRHDDMVEALGAALAQTRIGSPFDAGSQLGPLVSRRQRDRVEDYIAAAAADGAKLTSGGRRPSALDRGFFVEPTVFGNVENSSRIGREEVFGPVLAVIPVADDEAAVTIANDSIYGLNASVFTDDADRAFQVARRLRTGTVGHNAIRVDFGIAFGGFKQSGIGREGGREGLLPFLESKTIVLDGEPTRTTIDAIGTPA